MKVPRRNGGILSRKNFPNDACRNAAFAFGQLRAAASQFQPSGFVCKQAINGSCELSIGFNFLYRAASRNSLAIAAKFSMCGPITIGRETKAGSRML